MRLNTKQNALYLEKLGMGRGNGELSALNVAQTHANTVWHANKVLVVATTGVVPTEQEATKRSVTPFTRKTQEGELVKVYELMHNLHR